MNIYEELGIHPYINAHDTYTVYGGSRMSETTLDAMKQIAGHFVNMEELQRKIGERIADMTGNEAAFICNGAAGGLATAAAVCMAGESIYRFSKLPAIVQGTKDEVIVFRCQHNAYDKAIESTGAKMVLIGDADETLSFELNGAINDRTAAVFYFASSLYARASLSLNETIEIAHAHGVPVIVDAAAQLPPVENLSAFTKAGADLVIFSGGKTLCGPQDSGLILGRKELIELCIQYGAPNHGILRTCKASREAMVGLYQALKEYINKDEDEEYKRLLEIDYKLLDAASKIDSVRKTEIIHAGPVGQTYPRAFMYFGSAEEATKLHAYMLSDGVYTGLDVQKSAIYFSPLNINENETNIIVSILNRYAG